MKSENKERILTGWDTGERARDPQEGDGEDASRFQLRAINAR